MKTELLSLFLPSDLLLQFEIISITELGLLEAKQDCIYIELTEKNELPNSYTKELYESKGFYKPREIQDFPIRGKAVYLIIKRRRWRLKTDKKTIIKSDYSFISEGSKITAELSAFLKGTGRVSGRYNK